ncbi:MAG: cytochrome c, partial [Acidobacteriia bacterium]|nr:cytochrome c [Terriglobia bacterium]
MVRSFPLAIRLSAMRPRRLALLGAYVVATSGGLDAAPGLASESAGITSERPTPHLFLASDEGFTPSSSNADIEFRGQILIPRAGEHRFFHAAGTLRIDGREIGPGSVHLEAGRHAFEFRSPRQAGPLRVWLEWQGPGFGREPIPPRFFSHEPQGAGGPDGRALFEELGCSNCHRSESRSIARWPGPVLTDLGVRVKPAWIRHWLDAPENFRPWATMPQMLSATERGDVAAFLASLGTDPIPEPSFGEHHSRRGRTTFQSFGCTACHAGELALAGLGSKMAVGRLQEFLRAPLRYAPAGRMPSFHLTSDEALDLAAYLALSANAEFERPVASGDIDRGRRLVQTAGCLACHALEGLQAEHVAPKLAVLNSSQGCLSETSSTRTPRYRLAAGQRDALRSFIDGYRRAPDRVPAPTFDLRRRMRQLRCQGCHEIDGRAPTGVIAEDAPPLTGIGRKLNAPWIERVISSKEVSLDWQELRMPSYGSTHAAWLASALAKSAGVSPREAPAAPPARGRPGGPGLAGGGAGESGVGGEGRPG